MGNWHCIDSSCAKVHYREYLPPVVRWRYPGESWNEINADDYTIVQPPGQCDTNYHLQGRFEAAYKFNNPEACRGLWQWQSSPSSPVPGKIIGWDEFIINNFNSYWRIIYEDSNGSIRYYTQILDLIFRVPITNVTNCDQSGAKGWKGGFFSIDTIERADGEPDNCGDCIFTITKNNEIVHQETRDVCPEVEKLDCQLSEENKVIKIDKLPYLQRVEVVDYEIVKLFLNVFRGQIPDECLNIYLNDTTGIIPLPGGVPLPYTYTSWQLITQICSKPGCPPPEYQVICNCNCDTCPDDTCAVECDGHICCYDNNGIAIKSIAIEDYCEV